MKKKQTMHKLYMELVRLQSSIISSKRKLLLIIEGRDAAGKDGAIKEITRHLSPRETRVVALGKPSDRQGQEWYFQRFAVHLPASGEFVIFNRSWYNRAGVEKVMGFCSAREYKLFLEDVKLFEKMLVDADFIILKYYLDISRKEQKKRLDDRRKDPLKQWKISPIDKAAQKHWHDYSTARDAMLLKTNFEFAPWFVVNAENKPAARVALITHILNRLEYPKKNKKSLPRDEGLVYAATPGTIKNRLYP